MDRTERKKEVSPIHPSIISFRMLHTPTLVCGTFDRETFYDQTLDQEGKIFYRHSFLRVLLHLSSDPYSRVPRTQ